MWTLFYFDFFFILGNHVKRLQYSLADSFEMVDNVVKPSRKWTIVCLFF